MNNRSSALLPPVISVAVTVSMLSLSPLFAAPVFSSSLLLTVGLPGLIAAVAALLRLKRSCVILAALSGLILLIWLGTSITPASSPLTGIPNLFASGFQTLLRSTPPLPVEPALGWLLLFLAFMLWLVSYILAESLEQPAWVITPLVLPYALTALVHPTDLDFMSFLLVAGGYVAVLLTAGGPGLARGGLGFRLGRWFIGLLAATVATALTLGVTSLLPMGNKRPWLNNGPNTPIQLGDPTIELSHNLQRPSPVDVLTYRSSDRKPHYLRTTALTHLTAGGAQLESMKLRNSGISEAYNAPGEKIDLSVSMRFPSQYLPAPFAVDGFDAAGDWGFDQNSLSVVATGDQGADQTANLDYRVTSVIPNGGSSLATARAGSDPAGGETLKIPEGLSDEVRDLAAEITKNANTDGAKAKAIEEHLTSASFTYTLHAPTSTGTDIISDFLLRDKAGYCIHFATAMAILARIEGIPSRVAVGFTGGTQEGDGYKVTTDNMHAWPELYFEGLGWMPFEPTKSIGSSVTGENSSPAPPSSVPSTSPSTQTVSPEPKPTETTASPSSSPPQTPKGSSTNWTWLLWIFPVLLLLAFPAVTRLSLRAWRLRGGQSPVAAAAAAWRELAASHRDLGQEFLHGSPVEVAKTMEQDLPNATAAHLVEVAEVVQRSQFARETPPTDQLSERAKLLIHELRRNVPTPRRLLAFLLPRSLWRSKNIFSSRRNRDSR
ncbi:MAG: transglutaminase domain-containing protein [Propionibacterium sp.]|jgi:transglutaminase-like protein|nr:transglutaminase domain-containing protein [Propionibacterium sp.]